MMSWETRNGQRYYYRKKRINGRVCSEYWGRGPEADFIEEMHSCDPIERQIQNEVEGRQKTAEEALMNDLIDLDRQISALLHSELLAVGFLQHRGQWRKRRHET